jgi:ubiquinone/menaquinone biosynthesis C-methylase UbiE
MPRHDETRRAYEQGSLYDPSRICARPEKDPKAWADRLLADRLALVRTHYRGGTVLDLCCATGEHLLALAPDIERGIGLDFSHRYIVKAGEEARARNAGNLIFSQGDAKAMPLAEASVSLVYCFSSLYAIPEVEGVVKDTARVLEPGGIAVLDFGCGPSLNTYCLRYYTDWPPIFPVTLPAMRRMVRAAGFEMVDHRSYQILPLWAGLPRHLALLLHPAWREVLRRRVGGRMLDEWVSSLPGLRRFAFRHLVVLRKSSLSSTSGDLSE